MKVNKNCWRVDRKGYSLRTIEQAMRRVSRQTFKRFKHLLVQAEGS